MAPARSGSDAPTPSAALSRGLQAGVAAARAALERLFAPHAITSMSVEGLPEALALAEQEGTTGDPKLRHLGVAFDVEGPVKTRVLVLAGAGDDKRLAAALLQHPSVNERPLDANDRAAFSEMANIVASSFLNGVARELQLRLLPSIPSLEESPLHDVLRALQASHSWAMGARFTVALPSGAASGLFVAAPDLQALET